MKNLNGKALLLLILCIPVLSGCALLVAAGVATGSEPGLQCPMIGAQVGYLLRMKASK